VPLRAIDFHVHLPTPDWLDGSMAGYVEAAEANFRLPVQRHSLAELAARYRGLGLMAVQLAWDAETATGRPRVPNETVAAACRDHPSVFTGLGSVDPHKGPAAVAEVANIARLGLRGAHVRQAFFEYIEVYYNRKRLIMISGVTNFLPRPRVRARGTRSARPVRRHAVSSRCSAPRPWTYRAW
jgi:predicted TIM-barrel fold metal-dependent hydrolase